MAKIICVASHCDLLCEWPLDHGGGVCCVLVYVVHVLLLPGRVSQGKLVLGETPE